MKNLVGLHLPQRVAQPLATEFGHALERLSKVKKLLLINILSGILHELETTNVGSYGAAEYIHEQGIPAVVVGDLMPLLEQFDSYDSDIKQTVLTVLGLSL